MFEQPEAVRGTRVGDDVAGVGLEERVLNYVMSYDSCVVVPLAMSCVAVTG